MWFTTPWGIRWADQIDKELNSYLKKLWNLRIFVRVAKDNHVNLILYSVLVFDHIWWVRNKMLFKNIHISIEESIKTVRRKFLEFKNTLECVPQQEGLIRERRWWEIEILLREACWKSTLMRLWKVMEVT